MKSALVFLTKGTANATLFEKKHDADGKAKLLD